MNVPIHPRHAMAASSVGLLALLAALLMMPLCVRAATAQGTVISNQAALGVQLAQGGASLTVDSNAVDTVVQRPQGVVFDSRTNLPVIGAIVRLIDVTGAGNGGNAGGPAIVYQPDGLTRSPSTVTTDELGKFAFPLVASSLYRLDVEPLAGFTSPSVLPATAFPADRLVDPSGSYGRAFTVAASTGNVAFDLPVDSSATGYLFTQKSASRSRVEIGDFIDYTVQVRNVSPIELQNIVIHDRLPAGFVYEKNSARLNNEAVADPLGRPGPTLSFPVPAIASSATVSLRYRVRVDVGALRGDGTNRAQASVGALHVASNVAQSHVEVQGGVFSDESFVLGKVYADCNGNRVQDAGEPGVPQIRLYLEDGTFVITDDAGKFSFAGLSPRTHVLKIDPMTLPSGAHLESLANRNAGDAQSRFLDLKNGELQRADFAVEGCSDSVRATLDERHHRLDAAGEVTTSLRTDLTTQATAVPVGDARSRPASGVFGEQNGLPSDASRTSLALGVTPASAASALPVADGTSASPIAVMTPAASIPPEQVRAPGETGFLNLRDGETLMNAQAMVRLRGRADGQMTLLVNGVSVPAERVGKRAVSRDGLETREYIGVDLRAGTNSLTLAQTTAAGRTQTQTIRVVAPGELAKIIIQPLTEAPADGTSDAQLLIRIVDENAVAIGARTPVTLSATLGDLQVEDLDDQEPGIQTFVEGGGRKLDLRSPREPGESLVRATSGRLEGELHVPFFAELRPMLATGVIEGVLNLRRLDSRALVPARAQDAFEDEITGFATTSDSGKANAGARAALFLKGKVKGDYLLTMGYDSDKDTRERLFRDIQPDQFYPVYGDSSVKGFDAQSSGRLYVRVDKERSFLLYGDFLTQQSTNPARTLSAYNRSQNGLKEHYQSGPMTLNAFASRDSTQQIVTELRANGTSGPYLLATRGGLVNSEKVEILTRDRNQPAVILDSVAQSRFSDYEIEPFTGRLLLRRPVPSVDENLNPVSIRITYEVDTGGEAFWLAGTDAQLKLTDAVEVGGVFTDDRNPADPSKLSGVNLQVKLAETTTFTAEGARTDRRLTSGVGDGERAELRHDDGRLSLRAYAGRTDAQFNNPSAYLNRGRAEGGLRGAYRVEENLRIVSEAIHTADVSTGEKRDGILVGVERGFAHNTQLDLGTRYVHDERDPVQLAPTAAPVVETTSLRAKLSTQVPKHPQAQVYGEFEQALGASGKQLAAVGGEYQVANRGRIYVRHEFITSLEGPYALNGEQRQNTTVIGLDADYMRDGHTFNEYRVRDGLSGREAEAAFGLRNRWRIAEGLRADTGFERVHAFSDISQNEATAVTGALEYTRNPLWKGTARLELRTSPASDSVLNTLGVARKLSDDWTFLAKTIVFLTDDKTEESTDRNQSRVQVGVAYRDNQTNRWSGLARYEFRREDDGAALSGIEHSANIVSAHVNYQASESVIYTARYAGKRAVDRSNGLDSTSLAHLVSGRATVDITSRWDVGVIGSSLFSDRGAARQYGLGAELGRVLKDNLWLSVGYNVFGFQDNDLVGEDYTNSGVYLRLRFKFDENVFATSGGGR